jgi:hypothetical protein
MKSLIIAISFFANPAVGEPLNGSQSSDPVATRGGGEASSEETERRICRRIDDAAGRRSVTRRVCLTAQEWRERDRNSSN